MACTCGKCLGGVISPRMALRLEKTAAAAAELLAESLPEFRGNQAVHDPEVYLLEYVPPELRMEVTREFALGYGAALSTVGYLLRQGQLPRPRPLAQCMPLAPGADKGAVAAYLEKGGTPEYALDAVLAAAEQEASEEAAPGGDDAADAQAAALEALPACANDGQYELVRQQLFANSSFWPCGPYDMDDEGGDEGGDDGWVHYDAAGNVISGGGGGV